ncbi:MAG: L-aspartate oxidase, partial [Microcoleaceae cyanobacterium]
STKKITLNFSQVELNKIENLRCQIPDLLWQSAGICREAQSLETAIDQLTDWRNLFNQMEITKIIASLTPQQIIDWDMSDQQHIRNLKIWGETRNLLDISYTILKSSLFREESRGGHFRTDYPNTSANWQLHTLITDQQWFKSPAISD